MKKDKDKSLLDDRRFSIPLSILLAVALWMVVTMVINPNQSTTIYNVPVDFTYNSTSYTSKGLDIVNNPQKNVSLKLEGNGYDLSGLKAEDFVVYPDYSSVNGPGEVTLPLRVLVRDSASQVKASVNKDERVTVVFDSVEEKTFTVQVQASDLTIADGYKLQGTVASPSMVTVSGPASEVDRIDRIVARVEPSSDLENMSESKIKTVTLEAQDAEGEALSLQYTTMDTTVVDVTINIYQTKELPLVVNFINVPEGFDLNTLKYSLSQETMVVSGKPEALESLTELAVSDFDLSIDQAEAEGARWIRPNGVRLPIMGVEPERHAEHLYTMVGLAQKKPITDDNGNSFCVSNWSPEINFPALTKGEEEGKKEFAKRQSEQQHLATYHMLTRDECIGLEIALNEHENAHKAWLKRVLGDHHAS